MRTLLTCAAGAIFFAACALPGQADFVYLEAKAEGVERVRAYVRGGASFLSFYLGVVELEIVGEERDDFVFESIEGPRGGTVLSLERSGSTLEAVIDLGDYRILRVGLGGCKARLLVPAPFKGAMEVALKEGTLAVRGLELAELSASLDMGRMDISDLKAGALAVEAKEAAVALTRTTARSGTIRSTLGSVSADGLGGPWTIRTAEGSVRLGMAAGLSPLDISTTLGSVKIRLAQGEPFRFQADTQLWSPTADIPLSASTISRFPRDTKRYTGELGSGGPLVSVITNEGRVSLSSPAAP